MRSDWLTSVLHWATFVNSPCIIIDDDDLSLVTCRSHSYGLQKRLIHMASSSTGNLEHLQSDRLAPLAVHNNEDLLFEVPQQVRCWQRTICKVSCHSRTIRKHVKVRTGDILNNKITGVQLFTDDAMKYLEKDQGKSYRHQRILLHLVDTANAIHPHLF